MLLSKLCHNLLYIGDWGHWFCPNGVILLGVLKVGVFVTVQALSYYLIYGKVSFLLSKPCHTICGMGCGILLLTKHCHSAWCIGDVGHCYCPSVVILSVVWDVGYCYCPNIVILPGVYSRCGSLLLSNRCLTI